MGEPDDAQEGVVPSRRAVSLRALAVVAVVALLVAALVGGRSLVRGSVGPLSAGGGLSGPITFSGTEYRTIDTFGAGDGQTYLVDGNGAGSFGVRFEIENRGRVALTFRATDANEGFIYEKELRIRDRPIVGDPMLGSPVPLEGITLQPGERRLLETTFRWTKLCYHDSDAGYGVGSPAGVELRYEALWGLYERSQFLELPMTVSMLCGRDLPKADGWVVSAP